MSKGQETRPELLRMKPTEYVSGQEIESDVLRPVVFSSDNRFCRFELEPKVIYLHHHQFLSPLHQMLEQREYLFLLILESIL